MKNKEKMNHTEKEEKKMKKETPVKETKKVEKTEGEGRRNKEGEITLMIWGIPEKLRRDFRSRCIRRGMTMKEGVIKVMQDFLK